MTFWLIFVKYSLQYTCKIQFKISSKNRLNLSYLITKNKKPINNCQFPHFYKIISSTVTIYAVFFNLRLWFVKY